MRSIRLFPIGIDEVSKALGQMDEMTQQNAALVEQNAAIARSLGQRVEIMTGLIGGFRLEASEASRSKMPQPNLHLSRLSDRQKVAAA